MSRISWPRRLSLRGTGASPIARRSHACSRRLVPTLEWMEERVVLSTLSDGGTSTLTITLADNETFGIQSAGSTYSLTLSGTGSFVNGGVTSTSDFSAFGAGNLTINASGVSRYTSINITDAATSPSATLTNVDLVDSGANSYACSLNVTMNKSTAPAAVQIRSTNFTGTAGLNVTTTGGVQLLSGGISTVNGSVTLAGGTAGPLTAESQGVEVEAPITSSAGNITLTGTGGSGSHDDNNDGVRLINGGAANSDSGAITITGTAGPNSNSAGVIIENTGAATGTGATSQTGSIKITGSSSDPVNGDGVVISANVSVRSTGTTAGAAPITIKGTSTAGQGVRIDAVGTKVTSVAGDISITGSTAATSVNHYGVFILNSAVISSTGTGAHAAKITIDGTDTGDGLGVFIIGSSVTSADGAIQITGTGVPGGLYIQNGSVSASGTGSITLNGTSNATGSEFADGVNIYGSQVTTASNSIAITGNSASNNGVRVMVSSTVQSTGAGAITLNGTSTAGFTGGEGVAIDGSQVQSAGGDIQFTGITSSDCGVTVTAAAAVGTTGAGAITFHGTTTAGLSAANGHGALVSQSQVSTVDGNIAITGNTSSRVGVAIYSSSGLQVTGAGSITLDGTSTGTTQARGAETSASALGTVGGTIQITGSNAANGGVNLASGSTLAATGAASIVVASTAGALTSAAQISSAGGAIQVTGPSVQVSSGPVQTTGAANINLAASAGLLSVNSAVTTGTGNIQLNGNSIQLLGGPFQTTGAGTIQFTVATGFLSVNHATISAATALTLATPDTAASGNDISLTNGAVVQSTGSDVTIQAGDNVNLSSPSTASAAGKVSIASDVGVADTASSTLTVTGTLTGSSPATLTGGPNHDSINLFPLGSSTINCAVNIDGAGGNDSYQIKFGALNGPVSIAGTAAQGTDSLIMTGSAAGDSFTVSGTQTQGGTETVSYTSHITTLRVNGSSGPPVDNHFSVTPSATAAITINGGSSVAPAPGNTLLVTPPGGQTTTPTFSGPKAGVYHTTGGFQDVTFLNIDSAQPTTNPTVLSFQVLYGNGLSYDLLTNPARDLPWQINGIKVTFSEPVNATANSLQISGLGDLSLTGATFSGSGTTVLSWTLAKAAMNANVTATLLSSGANGIVDSNGGHPLDGNPSHAGPDNFAQAVQVLYGDVSGDGLVNSLDAIDELLRQRGLGVPVADIFLDVNGDGVVDANDLNIVRAQSGKKLV